MKEITYGIGGYDPTKPNNNIVQIEESPDPPRQPLDATGVQATLNAVLGLWTLTDAANAAGVEAEHLIAEAQAWAVAGETQ